ncbi:MAG: S-layer homology domain-containing protein, partial [Oscillospiraceae bacterium]|nr:S-layer homology domain-containing protein [Oscillospiraceae bacterium]
TRGQVVTFLWRSQGEPAPEGGNNPFTDVKEGDYFYEAVLWAVENGITTGLSPTEFGPNSPCNRAQVVTFLWRTMGKPAPADPTNPFGDVAEGVYYFDAVLWAVENGITTGMGEGIFAPNAACNRGQIVCFLYRTPGEDAEPSPEPEPKPEIKPEIDKNLSFALSENGDGYVVASCLEAAETVTIPAEYEGLIVVGIKGGAFMNCLNLKAINVDKDNKYMYSEDGVVFSKSAPKTLVCFPPSYDKANYYDVPSDVKAIGPYAFAGMSSLCSLTIPEGVISLGDYAFAGIRSHTDIFVPASLSQIGKNILQGQEANVPFYVPDWECPMGIYCSENKINMGIVIETADKETTVETSTPAHRTDNLVPAEGEIVYFDTYPLDEMDRYLTGDLWKLYKISEKEMASDGEVRSKGLEKVWAWIDPENPRIENYPLQTGLYGAGHTDGDAVLRAYDKNGALIAMQEVSGNFSFSFPDARNIGIEGGSNTAFTVVPIEPMFVQTVGAYAIDEEKCYHLPDGNIFQFLVIQYPRASVYHDFPYHLNYLSRTFIDCADINAGSLRDNYSFVHLYTFNASRVDEMKAYALVFDSMDVLVDNEELECVVAKSINYAPDFGEICLRLLRGLKELMMGVYYPDGQPVSKVTILGDGSYPTAALSHITLDRNTIENNEQYTIVHEMVHAIDQSVSKVSDISPDAWMEGRAEYISEKARGKLNISYYNDYSSFDWSFLSEEYKADFFRYFYFHTDRQNIYPVGYIFVKYLCESYGEDVMVDIMANIAASDVSGYKDEATAVAFKKAVEDATEIGVFQNFVRDVIG